MGLTLLIPDVPAVYLWPAFSVVLGSLAGVFCFADEQMRGTNKFWAERALPPGRMWLAKVMTSSGLLLSCLVIVLLPIVIATIFQGRRGYSEGGFAGFAAQVFRTKLISPGFPFTIGLFVWPLYGFAASLFSGMCFQKPLVSFAVGSMTGAMTAAMWIPSLLSGGSASMAGRSSGRLSSAFRPTIASRHST